MKINEYVQRLRELLGKSLSKAQVEEAVFEARSHLEDRAQELIGTGQTPEQAEQQAVEEFGESSVIAAEFQAVYPPQPLVEESKLKWLSRGLVAIWCSLAVFVFLTAGGLKGLGAVASMAITNSPMLVIPGVFGALGRVKNRKLRAALLPVKFANIGLGMALFGAVVLVGLTLFGKNQDAAMLPFHLCFAAASILGYTFMWLVQSNAEFALKVTGILRSRTK